MSFVHLHVHSEYSLLDGFSNIKKLTQRAAEMGMPALALTDHGTMFGVIEFFNAAREAGIKPVIGLETYMAARSMRERDPQEDKKSTHLLLLAENETGYKNLLQIASAAQLQGFYYYPRIDHEFLASHTAGLIATTGCLSAEIPRMIRQDNVAAARKRLAWYYEIFGPDNFFVELQQHAIPELTQVNRTLRELGKEFNSRFVATNDVHYIEPSDARLQDILLAIQTGALLSDPNRMRMSSQDYYLRSPQEMASLFADLPEALSNTLLIAERCNLDLSFKGYHLPQFQVPEGFTAQSYLRMLCEAGLLRRYGAHAADPEVRQRLEYELGVIHDMGFDTYFLIVWDLCREARDQHIWYNARGSGNGSIVAYTLDITMIEPIHHGLIFERFLNPGRISMPDIDMDFPDDRRAEMLAYTARKYGDDKVAQIITFGTLGARAAIRDVGRVMDIPLSEVDRVTKLIPNIPGKPVTIPQALEEQVEFKQLYQTETYLQELIDTAAKMEGVVRNAGTHAAGVVITDQPVIDYLPLHRPTGAAEESPVKTVTQFEMKILEKLGILKVDFLGLATLTIMARACNFIRQRHGVDFRLDNIPTTDPETYTLMGRGETAGVFQVEGSGMRRWLMQMKPQALENVIAMVALFRPGPMEFIPGYIRRMHGEEKVDYRHPLLESIFQETFGYPVYQEQLMFAAIKLAGYTPSEADDLRAAISKKIKDKLLKHEQKFIAGAVERGIDSDTAVAIFKDWEEFARYGFNKCLPGDVEILDASTGRLVSVADLYAKTIPLPETVTCDISGLKLQTGRVAAVVQNGIKPVYRLDTALGHSIQATANHPFMTYNGWRQLDELQPGDLIAVPRCIPVEGRTVWPDYEVIVLGHLLAEGNLCHPHAAYYYSQDPDQVADFVSAAEKFHNVHCTVATHKSTFSVYTGRSERRDPPGIVPWAKNNGIWGKKAQEKEIPAAAFELSNRQIGLLLSRMWEGDGHIDVKGRSLFYATASERMARQMQHLLLRLGIISRLRKVRFPYKEGRDGWQLFVTGDWNLKAFAEQIAYHFVSAKRQRDLDSLYLSRDATVTGTRDIIPIEIKQRVREAKEQSGVTWLDLNASCGVAQREFYPAHTATKRGFTRQTIGRLAGYFADPELKRYAESDIYWDEITRIEYVNEQQTYDLEVPGTHNFVANDILVHNSHAADYGVIAVETAYLKVHYPVEYMTALLAVSQSDTDKVALYVADCRRMGIKVEPPDINHSDWDFTIQDCPGGSSAIRFGLGAVKNVGHAPVEAILQARGDRPFTDINDLARRVDLRAVGKRSLECLIKVGALDAFGSRQALLAGLDLVTSISGSHFRAADMGQMSLFGAHTGVTEEITLPKIAGEVSRREMLNWERELIGLYVSDHPLSPVMEALTEAVTHFSGQLSEAAHEEKVRVAGIVTRMRPHQTKTGKLMGFVTLEDVQGNIELVVFPRTWEQVGELFEIDRVLLVDGKVDAQSGDPKVLVDTVSTELKRVVSADSHGQPRPPAANGPRPPARPAPKPAARPLPPAARRVSEPPPPDNWGDEQPSDASLSDWRAQEVVPGGFVLEGQNLPPTQVVRSETLAEALPAVVDEADGLPPAAEPVTPPAPATPSLMVAPAPPLATPAALPVAPALEPVPPPPAESPLRAERLDLPYILSPAAAYAGEDLHMITVVLRPGSDKVRDNLRLRQAYGILISYPGHDRFALQIFERGRGYRVEFPNFTTALCPELLTRLQGLVGADNILVEALTIQ